MLMFPPFCFSAPLSKLAPLPLLFNSTTVETGPARLHQCHQTQNQKHAGLPPAASVWSAALLWESQRRDFILRTARPMRSRLIQVSLHQRGTHSSQRPTSLRGRSVFLCMERLFLLTAPPSRRPLPHPPTTLNRGLFMAACRGRASEPDGRALELSQELQSAGTDWKHSEGPQCRLPGLNAVGWHGIGWHDGTV